MASWGRNQDPAAPGRFDSLDDAKINRFQLKIMFVSGMGFFTDAYDLFVIGIVVALLKTRVESFHRPGFLAELGDAAGLRGRRDRLRPGRRHPRPQEDLRLRGADPGHRGARVGVRAELHVPADLPDHPGDRHRRRLPGVGDDHERVLGQADPGPDGRPGVRDAGRGPDRRPAGGLDPARIGGLQRSHLADPARARRDTGAGGLLPAAPDSRDAPVRGGGRRPRGGRGRDRCGDRLRAAPRGRPRNRRRGIRRVRSAAS